MTAKHSTTLIPVGLSQCLMGDDVRYNGSNKHSRYCTQELAKYFQLVPFCPEMAIGLGVPRKPIRLVNVDGDTRVQGVDNPDQDVTQPLWQSGADFINRHQQLCGFIFTQKSPSCGLYDVKVYHQNGMPLEKGRGAFAAALTQTAPWLPVEEAGRLNDAQLRETFITAVYAYHDWFDQVIQPQKNRSTSKALIDFHARHKYMLMAHSVKAYQQLGRLLANLKNVDLDALKTEYLAIFMQAIKTPASRGMHTNVLEHIQGYLKRQLNSSQKQALNNAIHDYRKGIVPLIVPVSLLKHYTELYEDELTYINQQSYLNPYPKELGLRNVI